MQKVCLKNLNHRHQPELVQVANLVVVLEVKPSRFPIIDYE